MVVIPIDTEIDLIYQLGDKVLLTEDLIMHFMNDTLFINKEILLNLKSYVPGPRFRKIIMKYFIIIIMKIIMKIIVNGKNGYKF